MHVSFFHAWALWWQGRPVQELVLWGHPIFFWGRVGKVAEYFGALLAVVDIVGPERLEAFGETLKKRSEAGEDNHLGAVVARSRETVKQLREYFFYLMATGSSRARQQRRIHHLPEPERPELNRDAKLAARVLGTVFWVTMGGVVLYSCSHPTRNSRTADNSPWWLSLIAPFAAVPVLLLALYLVTWIYPLLAFTGRILIGIPPAVPYYLLVRPATWLLNRKHPDLPLKSLGLAAVMLGFPFDILAT